MSGFVCGLRRRCVLGRGMGCVRDLVVCGVCDPWAWDVGLVWGWGGGGSCVVSCGAPVVPGWGSVGWWLLGFGIWPSWFCLWRDLWAGVVWWLLWLGSLAWRGLVKPVSAFSSVGGVWVVGLWGLREVNRWEVSGL